MKNRFTFSAKPTIKVSRSKFDLSYHYKTSFNLGDLVPFYLQEIYPGDTFTLNDGFTIRTNSPFIRPIMDNLFVDTYYFFVPSRIIQDDWAEIFGENNDSYWTQPEEKRALNFNDTLDYFGIYKGTVGDKLGLPLTYVNGQKVSVGVKGLNILPFNAFAKIWNDWFRDENVEAPVNILTSVPSGFGVPDEPNTIDHGALAEDSGTYLFDETVDWGPTSYFGKLPKVNKLHDYFTSCLPSPQKGDPVDIPLSGQAVVKTSATDLLSGSQNPLHFLRKDGGTPGSFIFGGSPTVVGSSRVFGFGTGSLSGASIDNVVYPSNLYADLSTADFVNVNDLRFAIQLQRMLEKDARGGTRYKEYLEEHFGVMSPDSRLQRPELLGGKRIPLAIQQTTSTADTAGASSVNGKVGSVGAFSLSSGEAGYSKGFVEHGYVIGVMCVRQFHSYQQGIERLWTRIKRTDFYDPVFANIGEQPVYQQELAANGTGISNNKVWCDRENMDVFGYNEAWADLRYRPSKITGELSSIYPLSLDVWHLGDEYAPAPILNKAFINENEAFLNRALVVDSESSDQFILDCFHKNIGIRALPTYSIPGLVDHH